MKRYFCVLLLACAPAAKTMGEPEDEDGSSQQMMMTDAMMMATGATTAELLAAAAAKITFASIANGNASADAITGALSLASTSDTATVSWASSAASVTSSGSVTRPSCEDAPVTLTATVTLAGMNATVSFSLTVLADPALVLAAASLPFSVLSSEDALDLHNDLLLPATLACGINISWSSDNAAVSDDGHVVRPFHQAQNVTLTATLVRGAAQRIITFPLHVGLGAFSCEAWSTFEQPNVGSFAYGASGTLADPFWSCTASHLNAIHSYTSSYHKVGAAISLGDWTPIPSFSGTLTGVSGSAIDGMHISAPTGDELGFVKVLAGTVQDMAFTGADVTGHYSVGVIAGRTSSGAHILTSSVEGTVRGNYQVGGFVGVMQSGLIEGSLSNATVNGLGSGQNYFGGFVGELAVGANTVSGSTFMGSVDAPTGQFAGGIVGWSQLNTNVIACDSVGSVRAYIYAGGIVGTASQAAVIDACTSSGSVTAMQTAGGIVGGLSQNNPGQQTVISRCVSSANVSALDSAGGIAGDQRGGRIERSVSYATVQATSNAGGLVGSFSTALNIHESEVKQSASYGSVTGSDHVGGMFGTVQITATNSVNCGNGVMSDVGGVVSIIAGSGATNVAGFAGELFVGPPSGTGLQPSLQISRAFTVPSFADVVGEGFASAATGPIAATGLYFDADVAGTVSSAIGDSKTSAQMQTQATFSGYDFSNLWIMDTYPKLRVTP